MIYNDLNQYLSALNEWNLVPGKIKMGKFFVNVKGKLIRGEQWAANNPKPVYERASTNIDSTTPNSELIQYKRSHKHLK